MEREVVVAVLGVLAAVIGFATALVGRRKRHTVHILGPRQIAETEEVAKSVVARHETGEGSKLMVEAKSPSTATSQLVIEASEAFESDLGTDPMQNELILFSEQGRFSSMDTRNRQNHQFTGKIIVTNRRLICRGHHWTETRQSARDVRYMIRAIDLKEARIRIVGPGVLLIENTRCTAPYSTVTYGAVYLEVSPGLFRSTRKAVDRLLALLRTLPTAQIT